LIGQSLIEIGEISRLARSSAGTTTTALHSIKKIEQNTRSMSRPPQRP